MGEKEWISKGFALDDLKRYEEAIEAYEKAIELNPKNDYAWISKGFALAKKKFLNTAYKKDFEGVGKHFLRG